MSVRDFAGRCAFITGAANGIGFGIACALADEGVAIALADVDEAALAQARAAIASKGVRAHAIVLDVSDRAAFARAADEATSALGGPISIVVNNAGVTLGAVPVAELDDAAWDWILGVNLRGVANGIAAFLPRLQAQGGAAHIVNTASIGGLQVNPILRNGSYSATKYAVVALSETLALELEGSEIGISVLCPAAVPTTLNKSSERRPAHFGGPFQSASPPEAVEKMRATGESIEPEAIGRRVVAAIREGDFFIFTHPHTRAWLEDRHRRITDGFAQLDRYLASEGGTEKQRAGLRR